MKLAIMISSRAFVHGLLTLVTPSFGKVRCQVLRGVLSRVSNGGGFIIIVMGTYGFRVLLLVQFYMYAETRSQHNQGTRSCATTSNKLFLSAVNLATPSYIILSTRV